MRRSVNRVLAFVLVCCLLIPSVSYGTAAAAGENGINALQNVKECERQTVNFNREWKFVRRDIEGAEEETFNDSSWYNVGLPHDFSIPYWQDEKHFTGYGWYRKTFNVEQEWMGKRLSLDFAGVFHTAEIYINGTYVGEHRGGYTGFAFDITDYVRQGENTVAIRVNNIWQEDLAPRSGEHMFTGGIYRDVNLVITSPVHITWYGTFVQTPEVSKEGSFVRMQAEVQNESGAPQNVRVAHKVYDADNKIVKSFESEPRTIGAGDIYNFDNTSDYLSNPHLWTPDSPYMYKVITDVYVDGVSVDRCETPLGFRWMEWTADEGFFLNGEHFWIDGTNAHQDHAGWANAVTTAALKRDVAMIKEAGLNFIRGSHYPHSPAYAEACDEQGILFWSEAPFWCTSAWGEGTSDGNSKDYLSDGYPTTGNPETEARFEQSCLDSLRDMIRINRNHPSIIIWSMGNEAFFGENHDKKKALISRMAAYAKELDPTRKVAMGGTQMGGYDKLPNVDVAGYNGDGAEKSEYQDPGVPNMVSEYSTHTGNRPEKFRAYYGSVATDSEGNPLKPAWRSGHALWCAFHHGSILSRSYGDMGFIDYYRLPLQIWYYYREKNTGVERECSTDGTAAKLSLTASDTVITNDGTKDTHLIVTVEDADGNWVNKEPDVILEIVEGPGIFPTGKTMSFKPGDSMRDGKAAIEFRSYYAGTTTIEAYSPSNPDIEPASITITTTGSGSQAEPDISTMYGAFMSNGGIVPNTVEEAEAYRFVNYKGCPMNASSGDSGEYTCKNILDGDKQTEWKAQVPGSGQWLYVELEHGGLNLYKAQFSFKGKKYPYKISYKTTNIDDPEWITLKEYDRNTINDTPLEESFGGVYMRYIRIEFTDVPADEYANLAELRLYGIRNETEGYKTGEIYLSDVQWGDDMPDGVYPDSSVDLGEINIGGNKYDKGFGVKTNSEAVFDLEKYAARYCRFKCRAGIDGNSDVQGEVKICIYDDEELVYERTLTGKESVADIDVTVNKVKKLKLTASSDTEGIHVNWADAKLTGVTRNVSIDNAKDIVAESYINMDTLVPNENLCISTDIKNKLQSGRALAGAVNFYAKDGSLLDSKMAAVDVPGNTKKNMEITVNVPADITQGSYAVFTAWDRNTLIPVTESIIIATDEQAVYNKSGMQGMDGAFLSAENNREESQLKLAIKSAMRIIYPGDAEKYTLQSRAGFTDKLLNGGSVLNDKGLGQNDVDRAANEINEAIKNLKLVQTGTNNQSGSEGNISGQAPIVKNQEKPVPKKGSVHKAGKLKYKILVSSKTKGKVSVYKAKSKSLKKAVIPAKVKINGYNFKVTEISGKAFYKNKKLAKVIIGKNVSKIGKKAFFGDSKLKSVTIQSKSLKKAGTKAFANTNKKLKVKIPKKKKKTYGKLLKHYKAALVY
ncbi:MAG: leucine-rich repeat protein [Lachnospiraceae bacterium]|nr:leucine-rich repeat protein [Lachnospiraceae bacterium]